MEGVEPPGGPNKSMALVYYKAAAANGRLGHGQRLVLSAQHYTWSTAQGVDPAVTERGLQCTLSISKLQGARESSLCCLSSSTHAFCSCQKSLCARRSWGKLLAIFPSQWCWISFGAAECSMAMGPKCSRQTILLAGILQAFPEVKGRFSLLSMSGCLGSYNFHDRALSSASQRSWRRWGSEFSNSNTLQNAPHNLCNAALPQQLQDFWVAAECLSMDRACRAWRSAGNFWPSLHKLTKHASIWRCWAERGSRRSPKDFIESSAIRVGSSWPSRIASLSWLVLKCIECIDGTRVFEFARGRFTVAGVQQCIEHLTCNWSKSFQDWVGSSWQTKNSQATSAQIPWFHESVDRFLTAVPFSVMW